MYNAKNVRGLVVSYQQLAVRPHPEMLPFDKLRVNYSSMTGGDKKRVRQAQEIRKEEEQISP